MGANMLDSLKVTVFQVPPVTVTDGPTCQHQAPLLMKMRAVESTGISNGTHTWAVIPPPAMVAMTGSIPISP
jgi:hypothetical protein